MLVVCRSISKEKAQINKGMIANNQEVSKFPVCDNVPCAVDSMSSKIF